MNNFIFSYSNIVNYVLPKFLLFSTPKRSGNFKNFDKKGVKLFPNLTRPHLITQSPARSQALIIAPAGFWPKPEETP